MVLVWVGIFFFVVGFSIIVWVEVEVSVGVRSLVFRLGFVLGF